MHMRFVAATALALVALARIATAQSWRSFDVSRQAADSAPFSVNVSYGVGRVILRPDRARNLYDAHLRYDGERAEPVYRFDRSTRTLDLGVRFPERAGSWRRDHGGELRLTLSTLNIVDLALDVGAAESDIDLTGLRIRTLALTTGASDTRLRVDAPSLERARTVRIDAGAANVEAVHLANLGAERMTVNVGVGRVLLDLTGEWRGDLDVDLSAALGKVELLVPMSVGVRIETTSVLQSTEFAGLTRRDGAWLSDNFDTAPMKLRIRSSGALGRLEVRRSGS